jgi:hypothetical protein
MFRSSAVLKAGALVDSRFWRLLIRVDAQVLMRLMPFVWLVSRWTGWDGFRLARTMVIVSPVMLGVWWSLRYGAGDAITLMASLLWIICCWMKLIEFRREERDLRRAHADGCMVFPLSSAVLRVVTLDMFVFLDVVRNLFDTSPGWRGVVMVLTGFHCTVYALALYVHVIPPGPPPRRREKRDWLAWARPRPMAEAA